MSGKSHHLPALPHVTLPHVPLAPTAIRELRKAPHPVGQALLENFGGRRGVVDGVLPTVVFAVVNIAAGLVPAIWAASASGVAVTITRLVRREPVRQALSGLVGLGIACAWALHTHHATAFYLPGILLNGGYAVAIALSVVVRRPLVGVVLGLCHHDFVGWRARPLVRRALTWATVGWATFYAVSSGTKFLLYETGHATSLAVLKLALGTPALLALVAGSWWVGRAGLRAEERAARQSVVREANTAAS